jgi:hypothetical protein
LRSPSRGGARLRRYRRRSCELLASLATPPIVLPTPRPTSELAVQQLSNFFPLSRSNFFWPLLRFDISSSHFTTSFTRSSGITNPHYACPSSSLHRRYRLVTAFPPSLPYYSITDNNIRCRRRRKSLPRPTPDSRPTLLPITLLALPPLPNLAQHLQESRLPHRLQIALQLGVRNCELEPTHTPSPTALRIPTKGARKGGAGGQHEQPGCCG